MNCYLLWFIRFMSVVFKVGCGLRRYKIGGTNTIKSNFDFRIIEIKIIEQESMSHRRIAHFWLKNFSKISRKIWRKRILKLGTNFHKILGKLQENLEKFFGWKKESLRKISKKGESNFCSIPQFLGSSYICYYL